MLVGDGNQQDADVRDRVAGDIYARSRFHRGRLDRAGLGKSVHRISDLSRLPPMGLDDVRTPATLLLRTAPGPKGREARRYRPLQWVKAGTVPLAYSAEDLDLLAEAGAAIIEGAGVSTYDVLVNLLPAGPSRDHTQIVLGAQRAGVASIVLGPDAEANEVDVASPSVLVGTAKDITRLLDDAAVSGALDRVHTAIVVGDEPDERQRRRLTERLGHHDGSIVRAWAPEGVFAMWGQCRGGTGFHTWPTLEVIELVDPLSGLPVPAGSAGDVVWTGTGWHATALLRLRTGTAGVLIEGACPDCGRRSPRIEPVAEARGFAGVLDDNDHVLGWAAELQRSAVGDELVIWIVPAEPAISLLLLEELGESIGPAHVVMVGQDELDRRLADANGERYGDRRALPMDS